MLHQILVIVVNDMSIVYSDAYTEPEIDFHPVKELHISELENIGDVASMLPITVDTIFEPYICVYLVDSRSYKEIDR